MGVGGVARPCWGGGDAVYYGTITPLSRALTNLVGGTIGDYALFAGGAYGSTKVGTVTTYNSSLVKGAAQNLDVQRYDMASANTGDYLLFAGGYGSIVVDYYSSSLTKGKTSLPRSISGGFGINLGEYAFVAANQTNRSIACVYDSNLTMTELPNMSSPHALAGAANVGEYAIIVGGYSGTTIVNTVEVYNTGLTKLTNLTIPIATGGLSGCGTKSKTYALFAGGDINPSASLSTMTSTVYCFNASLTLLNSPSLSVAKELMGAINIEDTIIFAGGWDQAAYAPVNTVDVYTDNLTRQSPPPNNLSVARLYMGCATVGGYGIFAGGGQTGLNALTANVDVYTL